MYTEDRRRLLLDHVFLLDLHCELLNLGRSLSQHNTLYCFEIFRVNLVTVNIFQFIAYELIHYEILCVCISLVACNTS